MSYRNYLISIILIIFFASGNCYSQIDSINVHKRTLPFGQNLIKGKDIPRPLPFGVSAFFTYMSRDVDINNVSIESQDIPKQSITDFASFELNNKSSVAAIKFDTWLLPFVNVYGLFGSVSTDASIAATITYDRPVLPGPPVIIPVSNTSTINGNYYGIGTTCVAGYGDWFVLGDINYGYSKLEGLEAKMDFWMYSARSGFQSQAGKNKMRTWIGAMYLSSKRTLNLNVDNENLGLIQIEINQRTLSPWTIQLGTSFSVGEKFEILCEVGTNFDDASIGVLSGSYRF